jgi:hypothetical protein
LELPKNAVLAVNVAMKAELLCAFKIVWLRIVCVDCKKEV